MKAVTKPYSTKADEGKLASKAEQSGARLESPMPEQKQPRPGIENEVEPRPQYLAPNYKGSGKLQDKVALITGGDSGIGRSIAVLYAREGADVAIVFLPEGQVDTNETAAAVENEGQRCLPIAGDVKDPDFCESAVAGHVKGIRPFRYSGQQRGVPASSKVDPRYFE